MPDGVDYFGMASYMAALGSYGLWQPLRNVERRGASRGLKAPLDIKIGQISVVGRCTFENVPCPHWLIPCHSEIEKSPLQFEGPVWSHLWPPALSNPQETICRTFQLRARTRFFVEAVRGTQGGPECQRCRTWKLTGMSVRG